MTTYSSKQGSELTLDCVVLNAKTILGLIQQVIESNFRVMENPLFDNGSVNKIVLKFKNQLLKSSYWVKQMQIRDETLIVFARFLWRLKQLRKVVSCVRSPMSFMPKVYQTVDTQTGQINREWKFKDFSVFGRKSDCADMDFYKSLSHCIDPHFTLIDPRTNEYRNKLTYVESSYNSRNCEMLRKDSNVLHYRFLEYVCKVCFVPQWRCVPLWMFLNKDRQTECESMSSVPFKSLTLDKFLYTFVETVGYYVGGRGILDFAHMNSPDKMLSHIPRKRKSDSNELVDTAANIQKKRETCCQQLIKSQ